LIGIQDAGGNYIIELPTWSKTIYYAGAKIVYTHEDNEYRDTLDIIGNPTTAPLKVKVRFIKGES